MSVIGQATGRGDILLRRGVTDSFAVRWEQDTGTGFTPVDLSGWSAVCVIGSPQGEEWLTVPCTVSTDGLSEATFAHTLFVAPEWAARTHGEWYMNATSPDNTIERLGDGYFYLED